MALSAEFDNRADQVAYAIVATGAAALSYYHARTFFLPFMGPAGATVTPLLLDAVVYWLATACIRQARQGRPLPMLRLGAYAVLSLSVTANALGGATLWERVFMALPAALFGFLTEVQIRLALYAAEERDGGPRDRLTLALWAAHPLGTLRALIWKARRAAPAFASAAAERDRLRAARDAVRLTMPGRSKSVRRARNGVLRELSAGRLSPADAVAASGLLDRDDVHGLHRAALIAALGGTSRVRALTGADRTPDAPEDRTQSAPGSRTRTRTPGAPASRTRPHPGAVTDESAEMHFAAELADGKVPSQRRIKAELHVGQDRAAQIRARLETLAASDASTGPDPAGDLADDITPDDAERTVAS
ncbi:MAG: DUF2637 domain-containing protein [Trebonia sp.]